MFEVLDVNDSVTLVGHDWGGPLLFEWGRKNPEAVKGVVYMETIITPVTWDDWPESAPRVFQGMRSDAGEEMVLEKNVFVERILPASVLEPLPEEVMGVYRKPPARRDETPHPHVAPGDSHRRGARGHGPSHRSERGVVVERGSAQTLRKRRARLDHQEIGCERGCAPGPVRPRSPSPGLTSSRRTPGPRSEEPSPTGFVLSDVNAVPGELLTSDR